MHDKGLNAFQIKLIGIILMVCDHIAQFFPAAPLFLHWLGRPVAPIFLFMSSEGYIHTKNKFKYMLRLLSGFWLMNILTIIFTYLTDNPAQVITNNIFGTLFLGVLYMYLVDTFKTTETFMKKLFVLFLSLVPIYVNLLLMNLQERSPSSIYKIIKLIFPLPITTEGGIFIVLLAVLFYLYRDNRLYQFLALFAISTLYFFSNPEKPFTEHYQWMMCFSFLPLSLYNKQEGKKLQLFFYVFYPAHFYLLYFLYRLL